MAESGAPGLEPWIARAFAFGEGVLRNVAPTSAQSQPESYRRHDAVRECKPPGHEQDMRTLARLNRDVVALRVAKEF